MIAILGFFSALNPLKNIREYIKDRHERKKDKKYRERQEEKLTDLDITLKELEILDKTINIFEKMKCKDDSIKSIVTPKLIESLNKLDKHHDNLLDNSDIQ